MKQQFAKLKQTVKAHPKRSIATGAIILAAGIGIAAVTSNPAKYGMMVSNNGSGNAGTWVALTGTGSTPYSGSVTPAGLMVSSDGSGNPGTWIPATPTTFGTPSGAACSSATNTVFPCVVATVPATILNGTSGLAAQFLVNAPPSGFYCFGFYMTVTAVGTAGAAYGVVTYVGPTGYQAVRASGSLGSLNLTALNSDTLSIANGTDNVCFYEVYGSGNAIGYYITYSGATGTPQVNYSAVLTRYY